MTNLGRRIKLANATGSNSYPCDENGLLLKEGILLPRWQIVDFSDYPHIWLSCWDLCDVMNDIIKAKTGSYNWGLENIRHWGLNDIHRQEDFYRELRSNGLVKYKGIGKKTSRLILDMVESKFVLIYHDRFKDPSTPTPVTRDRWLLAIDSNHEDYKLLSETSSRDYDMVVSRIFVSEDTVRFLENDIMRGVFKAPVQGQGGVRE